MQQEPWRMRQRRKKEDRRQPEAKPADRQTYIQVCRQTNRLADRLTHTDTYRQTDEHGNKAYKKTY